ncbi:conserved protein of unknown function [Candidatus Hydrogenisulfobacillus filiaventi]|uniref:DUF1540 domain-containing protein n=1 Tax=Candidatus Hydrogenisulfobacillus filiaventi TaxID=2707344 RepID=A0A6F8ZGV5_9FIRM|nr:DUF1540 domain-containing protein [Bacillota bacterium]CAB1128939.1 conserved protein of unknown function [Candidatus Hydrogenisulfobacillus filiaventi]
MAQAPEVFCEVRTCGHWMAGDRCAAGKIDILMQDPRHMAGTVEETECKTFGRKDTLANMLGGLDNTNWSGAVMEPFAPGRQLNPAVTCVVKSCRYWVPGDGCRAAEIRVIGAQAQECQDTHCQTFVQ